MAKTAFVFQGGGSITATQVGMLRALLEHGIKPDLLVGSSAGAINAVRFAENPSLEGVRELEKLWLSITRKDVFSVSMQELVPALLGFSDGVASTKALRRLFERELRGIRLEQLRLPTHVIATDLAQGDAVMLSTGPAITALLASTALPGVFPPVEIGGRQLMDGGIASDTPVRQAEALGARTTYVLPCIGVSEDGPLLPHGAGPVVLRALSQLFGRASVSELAAARHTVHVLPAPTNGSPNPFDFRDTSRLISEGKELVADWLTQHPHVPGRGTPGPRAVHSLPPDAREQRRSPGSNPSVETP